MSYILKALKQAQESRSIDGTPVTAASQRLRSMERPRQIPWRWIAAAALVLNGLVLLLLLVLPRFGSQSPTSTAPPVTTAAPTTPVAPMAPEAPPAAVLPPRSVTGLRVEHLDGLAVERGPGARDRGARSGDTDATARTARGTGSATEAR